MAAIAARRRGARVRVFEKTAFPRHKVCGEFLSPEILAVLQRAECADEFLRLRPAAIRYMELHFGSRVVRHALPQPAYGLSRHALDQLLLDKATA
jgi:flavin-dependent dehydrogenase